MDYRLYPRENGIWYLEFFDDAGNRKRVSTKKKSEKAAKKFAEQLESIEFQKSQNQNRALFADYSAGFFDADGLLVKRWREHGKVLKRTTITGYRRYLEIFLLPWFGEMYLDEIDAKTFDNYLQHARKVNRSKNRDRVLPFLSGSSRNEIINTLTIILNEAVFDKKLKEVPNFKKFARNSKRQNTLSAEELQILFPFDQSEFGKKWVSPADEDDPIPGILFATMGALAVSCGLRSGEVCALSYEQIIPGKGIVIDRNVNASGEIDLPKKGTAIDPRVRPVPVSDYTFQILNRWIALRGTQPGFLFQYHGVMVDGNYLLRRFRRALRASGIDTSSRRITFHGLRYTFNSKMKPKMDRGDLQDIIGHMSDAMTDHYDRPIMEERLDDLRAKNLDALNGFWKVVG